MSIKQILDVRQSFSMTSDLQESIRILQYSSIDLENYITTQIESNPFLSSSEGEVESEETEESEAKDDNSLTEQELDFEKNICSSTEYDCDTEYASYSSATEYDFNNVVDKKNISLRDHILEQINLEIISNKKKIIATYLVDMLDDNGYIDINYELIQKYLRCSKKNINEVLEELQRFEPIGVFSRSLSECLTIQLKEKNIFDDVFANIINNLDLLANADLKTFKQLYNLDSDKIGEYLTIIKTLNPKPGNIFDYNVTQIIQPDIFLKKENSDYYLEINNQHITKVHVDKGYYKEVRSKIYTKESKKRLSEFYNNANWLLNSLEHRANTLMNVSLAIYERQKDFFQKGIDYLQPMSLQDIANDSGLSKSTISRVTTNKYISTPLGTLELKYFFSSSLCKSNNDEGVLSSKSAKHLIKQIVENESIKIYSDSDLVLLLMERGIKICRRTITKYREKMNIPSSSERRKGKKLLEII